MPYTSTTIAWRGKVAEAVNQVYKQRRANEERAGTITCPHCRSPLHFRVQPDGRSSGRCAAGSTCIHWVTP
jgi:hypothetical protein